MSERVTLGGFLAGLLVCVVAGWSILWALAFGLLLFCLFARKQGCTLRQIWRMCLDGLWTVRNILLVFLLIGMLTAVWRASGTIAFIIYSTTQFIPPQAFLLITFLLCCLLSVLTGTAFGSAATMGVICMTMGRSLGLNPALLGGAILSGVYFGDRWSPMSTSALLVCEVTGTDIYANLKRMAKTAVLPLLLTCGVYLALGFSAGGAGEDGGIRQLFAQHFSLHWVTAVPAVLILVLSLCKVKVRITMLCSILAAGAVCLWVQGTPPLELLRLCLTGYVSPSPQLAGMMNGGGIQSMVRVAAIICISSAYAGIFKATGLLHGVQASIQRLSGAIQPHGCVLLAALLTSLVSCNQTLAILLTKELCGDMMEDPAQLALTLEDTAVLLAPLVPWSIAGAVPLSTVGAPLTGLLAACYLYLLPICSYAGALSRARREKKTA